MNSTLAIFKNFPQSKDEISVAIKNIKAEIMSGDFSPLEIDLHLKKIEEVVKGIREDKEVKSVVLDELLKYSEKTVKAYGCEISKVNRSSWDYDLCNDSELFNLEREAMAANERLKDRQKFLQSLRDEMTIVTSDGVIETICPPLKKSTETFSIKIL